MSDDYDEVININQTLDLTYLIEEKEKNYFETDITFNKDFDEKDNYKLYSTNGLLFEPEETGEYEIKINNEQELSIQVTDRPDSLIERDDDNNDTTQSDKQGTLISLESVWADFQSEISNNSDQFTTVEIYEWNGGDGNEELLKSVDVSSKESGDVVTFESVNLEPETDYAITLDNEDGDVVAGYNDNEGTPQNSADDEITVKTSVQGGDENTNVWLCWTKLGNIDLS